MKSNGLIFVTFIISLFAMACSAKKDCVKFCDALVSANCSEAPTTEECKTTCEQNAPICPSEANDYIACVSTNISNEQVECDEEDKPQYTGTACSEEEGTLTGCALLELFSAAEDS